MQADFDNKTGRLNFYHPALPGVAINSGSVWADFHLENGAHCRALLTSVGNSLHEQSFVDAHGSGTLREIYTTTDPKGIALTYRIKSYSQRPFLLLQLSLHNHRPTPIYLQKFCLLGAIPANSGSLLIAPSSFGLRLLKIGWLGWSYTGLRTPQDSDSTSWLDRLTSQSYANPVTSRLHRSGEFSSEGWTVLLGDAAAIVLGLISTAHQFGEIYACIRPGEAALMLTTQMDGVRLDPGEMRDSEWGFLQFVPLPNPEPQAEFVQTLSRQMQARVPVKPPPPMWTHWYQYFHDISEQRFLANLDVLVDHRQDIPYQVVELDDGYQSAWGDWLITNDRFPHGLEWLSGQIKARGFTPGLWLAPFTLQGNSQLARQHPEWLLKDRHAKPLKAGFLYNMFIQALDLTHPAVLEHLHNLASTLASHWGFALLKIDFLNTAALPGKRSDPKQTRAEALHAGLEALRVGAGDETFLLGCGCPFGPAVGIVDAMRIGPDTAPSWEPYFHWLSWARPLIKAHPSMPSLRNALRNTLNLNSLHKRWWWNDPDCLLVRDQDSRLTEAEVQSNVTLVGLSGGMLVSSDDLLNLSPQRMKWVSQLVPNLGLQGMPLDGFKREMPGTYRVRVKENDHEWQLLALFNWENHPSDLHVNLADLGYKPGSLLHVFDFWQATYHPVIEPEIVFTRVPTHGCKLLRICQAADRPQLVGDTLHISMGKEITTLEFSSQHVAIESLDCTRVLEGKLWLCTQATLQEASFNGKGVKIEPLGQGIYCLDILSQKE